MKLLLASVIAVAGGWTTAGCAPQPLTKADVDGKVVCNVDLMDKVERAARRSNTEVHWVNCPRATLRVS